MTGTASAYDFLRAADRFTTRGVSALVTADVLLMAGTDDHYVPLRQLHRQAAALTRARSVTTRTFTAAEQAQNHCQIGNVGAAMRVLLAWLRSLERDQASPPVPGALPGAARPSRRAAR